MKFHDISFIYKLQSFKWRYFRFRSVTITITHRHTRPWKRWPNTIRIGCSPTVFSRLGPQRLLSVPKPQAVAPGKEIHIEWGSHRGNRGVFRRLGRFVLQKGHRNVGKSLYQMYRPRRQLCWGINIILPKKRLFSLKIPGLFSQCSIYMYIYRYYIYI